MRILRVTHSRSFVKLNLFSKFPEIKNEFEFKESLAIYDLITYRSRKAGYYNENGFVLCPSEELKKLYGDRYSYGIRELESLNLIEPLWHYDNETGESYKYDRDKGIATSYRITKYADNIVKNKHFQYIQNEFLYKVPKSRKGKFKLKTDSNNPKNIKLLESYQGISIDPDWIELFKNPRFFPPDHYKYPSEPIARSSFFYHAKGLIESIIRKEINVNTDSKCGRAFHPIILMSSVLRPFLRYNGQPLLTIDATAFHPNLIASCIKDKILREKYLDSVRAGFYENFRDSTHGRDSIKVAMQKFLSGKKTNDSKVLEIGKWFQDNFPDVSMKIKRLKNKGTTFQMYLQQLESRIFVDGVFMKASFWAVPLHDGLAVLEEDKTSAIEFINKVCESELGYSIPLKSKISESLFSFN